MFQQYNPDKQKKYKYIYIYISNNSQTLIHELVTYLCQTKLLHRDTIMEQLDVITFIEFDIIKTLLINIQTTNNNNI